MHTITPHKRKIMQAFDARTQEYECHADIQKDIAKLLSKSLPNKADSVLEIGCGTGFLTQYLIDKYPQAQFDITDISPNMVAHTEGKFSSIPHARFMVMDGEAVMPDKTYDLIVSSMAFQWFENPNESLRALVHRLNDGGQLIFSTLHPTSFPEWRGISQEMNIPVGLLEPKEMGGCKNIEAIQKTYPNGLEFLRDLKRIGANTPNHTYKPNSAKDILSLCRAFDCGDRVITWKIAYHVLDKSSFSDGV